MRYQLIAVGNKLPQWCQEACAEYLTRMGRFMKCQLIEIPTSNKEGEGQKILQKINSQTCLVALSIPGQLWSSKDLSQKLSQWQLNAQDVAFVIGGPDGLSEACLKRAQLQWSLSPLTFPHTMARLMVLEQLYRASSLLQNHPYHRE